MKKRDGFPWFVPPFYDVPEFDHFHAPQWRNAMKKRLAVFVVIIAALCAITVSQALAATNSQIGSAVNRVESGGGAKWVNIFYRTGTNSGTFTAQICTNTIYTTTAAYYYPYTMVFTIPNDRYGTNANGSVYVIMGNSISSSGSRC